VDYAHKNHIVHRDLKPANVLCAGAMEAPVAQCVLKIADFGLAKRLDSDNGQTQSNAILGTPSYMAPEQADRKFGAIGPATDVYALGAILYELLTGHAPFVGANVAETLGQVTDKEPVPPAQLQPKTPRDLETICLKCLAKEPSRRYRTARELADDLRRFQAKLPVKARRVGKWERAWRWRRRHPLLASLCGALTLTVLTVLVLGGCLWYQAVQKERATEANVVQLRRLLRDLMAAGNGPWQQVAERRQARRRILEEVCGHYRELCAARPGDPELRSEFAEALTALAEVALSEERYEAARDSCVEASPCGENW
jgi:eukaryotic-like serine/threonine-protein kinase